MRLINSSVEIIPQEPGLLGVYKQIEIGGRTAYKSEDKITNDSSKAFVDMLISRGHTAPLEQGTIYLQRNATPEALLWQNKYSNNKYSVSKIVSKINTTEPGMIVVTTNARVIYENDWQDDLRYMCEPTKYHEKRVTVRFVCSRSISHELVRHRVFSFVQESTRYCNYSKAKFGNQLTFVLPSWVFIPTGTYTNLYYDYETDRSFICIDDKKYVFGDESEPSMPAIPNRFFNFIQPLYYAEQNYLCGLERGFKPQEMREVLPNALKTEVVMTGFVSDWIHFFNLRLAQSAHPDMRELATVLHSQFVDNKIINGVC